MLEVCQKSQRPFVFRQRVTDPFRDVVWFISAWPLVLFPHLFFLNNSNGVGVSLEALFTWK